MRARTAVCTVGIATATTTNSAYNTKKYEISLLHSFGGCMTQQTGSMNSADVLWFNKCP